jgi:hypothetical protein
MAMHAEEEDAPHAGRELSQSDVGLSKALLGWRSYYGFSEVPTHFGSWRSRLRCYLWKQWGRRGYPGVEAPGSECGPGFGNGEVGAWSLAVEPEPSVDDHPTGWVLPKNGLTEVGERIRRPTQSTEVPCNVIRMQSGVGAGAREGALPIPIRQPDDY